MIDIKAAIQYLFEAGQKEQKQHRDEISEICPGMYANKEGQLAVGLNRAIDRRNLLPCEVVRRDVTTDVESFVALVKRHKTETTEVFVGEDTAVAVLEVDGWRKHTIALPLERSESWKFWSTRMERLTEDVADDVAARRDDILGADGVSGAQLLECLSDIDWISEDSTRVSHTATGLTIKHKSDDRVAELPGEFSVGIPVYTFEDCLHRVCIRLSARRINGDRAIVFTPIGVSLAERGALRLLINSLGAGIGDVPVFAGRAQLDLDK